MNFVNKFSKLLDCEDRLELKYFTFNINFSIQFLFLDNTNLFPPLTMGRNLDLRSRVYIVVMPSTTSPIGPVVNTRILN